MRLIGLTGGISTGKTTVSNYLAKTYRLPIWDADLYARQAVSIGSPVLDAIVNHYGSNILLSDGNLNRQQLASIIFADPSERTWLEKQIHPFVRDCFVKNIQQLSVEKIRSSSPEPGEQPDAVLVIPLLFEAGMTDLVTEIWVVYCSPEQQKLRLIQRENAISKSSLTLEQAQARIDSQMPLIDKCRLADIILENYSTPEALFQQVDAAVQSFHKIQKKG